MTLINALPGTLDLSTEANQIHQGAYYSRIITLMNAAGVPIDCSVATGNKYASNPVQMKFVNDQGSTTGCPGTDGIVSCPWVAGGAGGKFTLVLLNSQVDAITQMKGKFDILVQDDAGNVERIGEGSWKVSDFLEVTTTGDPA